MASSKIRGITIELSADASGVIESVNEIGKQIKSTKTQLKEVDSLLKFDPTNTELLEQKTELLKKQIGQTKEKLDALKTAQADMDANGVDQNSEQYQALQREIIATEQQLKALESTAGSGSATLAQISAVTGEWGDKLTDAGKKLSVVSAGLVAFGTAAVKAFNEVDEGADIVVKKTGATGEAADALQEAYTNVAQSIVADFTDIGTAIGEVNTRFGLTGTELEDLSTTFLKFAEINDIDVQTAVEGVDQALKTFNVDGSEANDFMGLLTATSQATGISMGELLTNLQQYGPALKEMGLDLDDAVVLMGNFEEAGIDSSDMLSKLQKAASYYNEQGLSMEEGLSDLITRLQDSSTEADATAEAYEIFGKRGGLAFVTAAKEGKLSIGDLETSMDDYSTVVDDTYQATLDGTDSMALAWQNLQLALAAVGEAIGETLAPIMEKITGVLQDFTDWFSSLDDSTQNTIVTIGLIVAAIGPLLLILGKVMTGISNITSALSTMGTSATGPIGLAILAIAALVGGTLALADSLHNAWLESSPFTESLSEIETANANLATAIANTRKAYEDTTKSTETNAAAAQGLYDHLQDLMEAYDGTEASQEEIKATVGSLNQLVPGLGLSWDGVTNSLNLTNEEILANIEAMEAQAKVIALQDMYVEALKNQYAAQQTLNDSITSAKGIMSEYGLDIETVLGLLNTSLNPLDQLTEYLMLNGQGFTTSKEKARETAQALINYFDAADNAKDATEEVNWVEELLADAFVEAAGAANDTGEAMDDLADDTEDAVGRMGDAAPTAGASGKALKDAFMNEMNKTKLEMTRVGTVASSNFSGSVLAGQPTAVQKAGIFVNGTMNAMVAALNARQPDVEGAVSDIETGMETSISPVEQAMTDAGDSSASNLDSSFGAWAATVERTVTKMYNLFQNIIGHALVNDMTIWGDKIGSAFNSGVQGSTAGIGSIADRISGGIRSGFAGLPDFLRGVGYNAGEGLYEGLAAWGGSLNDLARRIANSVSSTLRSVLQIRSPSRVMEQIGMYTGEGLEVGLEKSAAGIYSAVNAIAGGITSGIPTQIPMELTGINAAQTITAEREAMQAAPSAELLSIVSLLSSYMPYLAEQQNIVLDDGTLAGHMAPKMNIALQELSTRAARG